MLPPDVGPLHDSVHPETDPDDPLLQFLPEEREEPVVTEPILVEPSLHEFPDESQIPIVRETRQFRLAVAPVTTLSRIVNRPQTRHHARRTPGAQLTRDCRAGLINRASAIGAFGAKRVERLGVAFATYARAARDFSLVVAGLTLVRRVAAWVTGLRGVRALGLNTWPVSFTCGIAVGVIGTWLFAAPPPPQVTAPTADTSPTVTTASILGAPTYDGSASSEDRAVAHTVDTDTVELAVSFPIVGSDRSAQPGSPAAVPPRGVEEPLRELPSVVAPSMQFKGSLALHSWPQGARAFVDGKAVGSTPIILTGLPVGSRVVRMEAEGYQIWSAAVRVVADQQERVTATLYRPPSLP